MKNNSALPSFGKNHHATSFHFFIRSFLLNCLLILIPLLLIGSYSIYRTAKESEENSANNAFQTLKQTDNLLESFFVHVDNAYLFFVSNPRANQQLTTAFSEKSLSLNSIKAIENLSANFQYLLYTNNYIRNIYIYYQNDYHRIFVPLNSSLISFPADKEDEILASYNHAGNENVWMEVSNAPLLYTDYTTDNLLVFRKLYRRTTDVQNGLVVFSFNLEKAETELNEFLEYNNQHLFLVSPSNQLVWPVSDAFKSDDILALAQKMSSDENSGNVRGVRQDYNSYTVSYFHSPRSYGFSYLLLTPKKEIYQTTTSLIKMYIIIILSAILIACLLAYFKTRRDYKYLNKIITVFSSPDTSLREIKPTSKINSNPFEFILMNIIHLFIEQDYLKMQDSEKTAKLQLAKIQMLQHQINPHFLHNTLNGIYWESVKLTGSENTCSRMISDLSSIMRYSLSDPQDDVIIQEEIDYLQKYLTIMQLRYTNKFQFVFSIDADCASCHMKKMLLQPIVENSIYHGIKEKAGTGIIRIDVHQKKDWIYFTIYDSGNGITPDKLENIRETLKSTDIMTNQHIGLINTNSRLVLSYGSSSQLHIRSVCGKFTVLWFSIPFGRDSV